MKAIDIKNNLNEYLLDKDRHISNEKIKSSCLIGNGERTCRYMMMTGKNGFVCAKRTPMSKILDNLVNENKITAKGNNCEGLGLPYEKEKKETENNTED